MISLAIPARKLSSAKIALSRRSKSFFVRERKLFSFVLGNIVLKTHQFKPIRWDKKKFVCTAYGMMA